ncbi:MAG TPA: hypothetical protein VEF55_00040, partial [Candidatus Binatia bacterium]|nr:hypothetical protein [Candidatus Binatia bacterium]
LRLQLDSNLSLLRWLCALAVVAMVAGIVWPLAFCAALVVAPDKMLVLLHPPLFVAILVAAAILIVPRLLLALSRCARCSRSLFSDSRNSLEALSGGGEHWHDYRAKPLLGSYAAGAMLRMARTGSVRCMWCGYQLGENRERVVLGPEV